MAQTPTKINLIFEPARPSKTQQRQRRPPLLRSGFFGRSSTSASTSRRASTALEDDASMETLVEPPSKPAYFGTRRSRTDSCTSSEEPAAPKKSDRLRLSIAQRLVLRSL